MLRGALSLGSVCGGTLALGVVAGCSQDHDLLGKDPATSSSASSSGSAGGAGGGAGGGEQGGGGGGVVEPPGTTRLTVVNGVNDHDAIRLCFLAYPDGTGAGVAPWPSSSAGLPFSRASTLDLLAPALPQGTAVRAHVIAGDLTATTGKDCAQILALAADSPAPIVAAALPVLPASVFEAQKSLLLVPTGCLGGAGHSDPNQARGCGETYTIDTPTPGLVAVAMSRLTAPDKVGLQVVHASAAMPPVDVLLTPGRQGETGRPLADRLSFGAIGPFPPFRELALSDLGAIDDVAVQTAAPSNPNATSSVRLGDILGHSEVTTADITDGKGVVLVAVGAAPGTSAGAFWHPLTYVLVRPEP